MLRRQFNPDLDYAYAIYARMSSDQQNPRSPDQQIDEVDRRVVINRRPWKKVKSYRDDASKGAYINRRPGFQQMLQDIRSGALVVDLILVDTSERLGRSQDLDAIRKELREQHGVLILSAHTNFADPTTSQGRVFEAFESMRATEENNVKAHQVLRSKRDMVKAGFWPGGPRPFGFELVPKTSVRDGVHSVQGSVLERFSEEDWIIVRLFERALATGEGQTRLAKFLNADPTIPERFRPFHGPTIGYWLDQEIYYGELVWPKLSTGIVNDTRRVEANPVEELIRVPNFCPAIVSQDMWQAVQSVRQARRLHQQTRRRKGIAESDQKQIAPLAPGMTLAYLLSGLVRCGLCNASMRPSTSGQTSQAGKTYTYYACPRGIEGTCPNKTYVPEAWLRSVVVDQIKLSLFPQG